MPKNIITIIFLLCFSFFAPEVKGEETKDQVINKVIKAYGGEKLGSIKTISFNDDSKVFNFGQSTSPFDTDFENNKFQINIDFKNNKKSFQNIITSGESIYIFHQTFDDGKGVTFDHALKTYDNVSWLTFNNSDRGLSYTFDTFLALELRNNKEKALLVGNELNAGRVHNKISIPFRDNLTLTLFIDKNTGFITKMVMPQGGNDWPDVYHYYNHASHEGIVFATEFYQTSNGQPATISSSRSISLNTNIEDSFKIPNNFSPTSGSLDYPEMVVQKIDENIYLVGQYWGFSLFMDMGDHFIATGGYAQLKDRFNAVKTFSKMDKPLKYQIVTHHHQDHIAGMKDAADLGVTFITVGDHIEAIQKQVGYHLPDDRFLNFNDANILFDGKIIIMDIQTDHSTHNLVPYFAEGKTVFSADTFYSRNAKGSPANDANLVLFKNQLDAYGLDIEYFTSAHSGRILTNENFLEASKKPLLDKAQCPDTWDFCFN